MTYEEAVELNGEPCPNCGAGMCKHGICDNFCNNDGEHCKICFRRIGAENMVIAERNAGQRAAILVGGFEDEKEPRRFARWGVRYPGWPYVD